MAQWFREDTIGLIEKISDNFISIGDCHLRIGGKPYKANSATLNINSNGLLGLDTGLKEPNTSYNIFAVATGLEATFIISKNDSPLGYVIFRKIYRIDTDENSAINRVDINYLNYGLETINFINSIDQTKEVKEFKANIVGNRIIPLWDWSAPIKLDDPVNIPTGDGKITAWSPDGRFLSVAHEVSPFITIYERSGTTFTKLANPATLPTSGGIGTGWSPDGRFLSVAHASTPFITIYERSEATFTKLEDPNTLPTGTGFGTAWSPDGRFLSVTHFTSPFITVYETNSEKPDTYNAVPLILFKK